MKQRPNRFQKAILKGIGVDRYLSEYEARKKAAFEKGGKISSERFEEMEKLIWYKGNSETLEWFYKTNVENLQYHSFPFWRVVNTPVPRVHYGLPHMISKTFGTLLFNQQPEFSVESGSKARNEDYEKQIALINELNDSITLFQKAARIQSYSGGVAIKLNYDSSLSDLPLFTIYPKERYTVEKRFGQIVEINFIDEYGEYRLVSSYGRGYINYKLFKEDKEVNLDKIEETAHLRDVVFIDEEQNLLNLMFGVVVDNPGEQSDYEGLISSFHALDETYSSLINYIRKVKPHIFITEDISPKDSSGRTLPFNDFDNIVTILDGTPSGEATEISRDLVKVDPKGYLETMESIQRNILSKVGISPASVGMVDAGANASGEALQIREWTSNRTRNEKLTIWRERLNEFYYAALVFTKLTKEAEELEEGGTFLVRELPDFQVKIDFGEFIKESEEARIDRYSKAMKAGLISVEFAVRKIWGDELSEDEVIELVAQIKGTQGDKV